MSIIVSHATARACHRALDRTSLRAAIPLHEAPLRSDIPSLPLIKRTRRTLNELGVVLNANEPLDILVGSPSCRRAHPGVRCHVWSRPIPTGSLIQLDCSIFTVDVRMCALQAMHYLDTPEAVEYLYELCSQYETCGQHETTPDAAASARPTNRERSIALPACQPRTSTEELTAYLDCVPGARGSDKLRRMLRYTRNCSRSPMETALLMLLTLPAREGGLSVRDVCMDHRIDVSARARTLTRRSFFLCDGYIPRLKLDIEYNGLYHESDRQQAIDEERRAALETMGYRVLVITKHSLLDKAGFDRMMRRLLGLLGRRPCRVSEEFLTRQEHLRRFVLRRWLPRNVADTPQS